MSLLLIHDDEKVSHNLRWELKYHTSLQAQQRMRMGGECSAVILNKKCTPTNSHGHSRLLVRNSYYLVVSKCFFVISHINHILIYIFILCLFTNLFIYSSIYFLVHFFHLFLYIRFCIKLFVSLLIFIFASIFIISVFEFSCYFLQVPYTIMCFYGNPKSGHRGCV